MKRLSFITQLKIQFKLLFISCRKALEKLPDLKVRNIFYEKSTQKICTKNLSIPLFSLGK